jgi:hypothetical protein
VPNGRCKVEAWERKEGGREAAMFVEFDLWSLTRAVFDRCEREDERVQAGGFNPAIDALSSIII